MKWWRRGLHRHGIIWTLATELALAILVAGVLIPALAPLIEAAKYHLSADTISLVGQTDAKLASKLTYDTKTASYQFNAAAVKAFDSTSPTKQTTGSPSSSDSLYAVTVPTTLAGGVTYTDINSQLSFSLAPQFSSSDGKTEHGHLVYPLGSGAQAIYTLKNNGLKEDIVVAGATSDDQTYRYKLNLPATLEAKIIPGSGGAVGIYSADPALFGDMTYGSSDDQTAITNARVKAAKNYLVFGLPAPVIKATRGGSIGEAKAHFELTDNSLSVVASGLKTVRGAITIDPSVVVTSTADFNTSYAVEGGNIDFSTAGQISRGSLTGGSVGTWITTSASQAVLEHAGSVIYNGYIYVIGGANRIASTFTAAVQYAPLNSDGSIGTWNTTTSLPYTINNGGVVAYDGYLYQLGGVSSHVGNTAGSDSFYAPINANGTIGSWIATTSIPAAAESFGANVYNGYVYVLGGSINGQPANYKSDVYMAPLNADGTIGTWVATTSLTYTRTTVSTNVYNGYIYVLGGASTSGFVVDDLYAKINSDGTIGAWMTTSEFSGARYGMVTTMANGYAYLVGGWSGGNNFKNDVQYAPINANGSLGTWVTTTSFTANARTYAVGGVYNGYLYNGTGWDNSTDDADFQYTKIDPAGINGPFTTSANAFTTTRRGLQEVAYNGHLYEMGGDNGSTPVNTISAATINADGTIGAFTSTGMTAFTTARTYFGAFADSGYMYVLGGCTTAFGSCNTNANATATVYSAPIASDGTIGTWTAQTSFTTGRFAFGLAVSGGFVYVIAGEQGTTMQSDIQYASLATPGTISGWVTSAKTTLQATAGFGMVAYGGKLYMDGGCTNGSFISCTGIAFTLVYIGLTPTGDINTGGWITGTPLSGTTRARIGLKMTAANGFLYIAGGTNGVADYSDFNSSAINADGSNNAFTTGQTFANGVTDGALAIYNGMAYVSGGYDGTSYYTSVRLANINNGGSGATGSYTTNATDMSAVYPNGIAYQQAFASGGYIYSVGGYTTTGGVNHSDVNYAPMNADGSVGSWTATSTMTTAHLQFGLAVYNGYVYAVAGQNAGGRITTVEYAAINSSGGLGTWATTSSTVAGLGAHSYPSVAAYNGYLYMWGGNTATSTVTNDVEFAPINANGTLGAWSATTSFATARMGQSGVINNGYIYVMGGTDNAGTYYNDVQYAPLSSSTGAVGTWLTTTNLLGTRSYGNVMAANGFMYFANGRNGSTNYSDTETAAFNANGTLGAWQVNPGSTVPSSRTTGAAIIARGQLYILGGVNGATFDSDVDYAPMVAIARTASYSRLLSFSSPQYIKSLTYNGNIRAPSVPITFKIAGANGVFGSSLQTSSITAGLNACVPSSISNAQYVQVNITLTDNTNAAFPDSATTPASITDFTVTNAPAHPVPTARLHLGKTLTSGTQAGLDTCGS